MSATTNAWTRASCSRREVNRISYALNRPPQATAERCCFTACSKRQFVAQHHTHHPTTRATAATQQ